MRLLILLAQLATTNPNSPATITLAPSNPICTDMPAKNVELRKNFPDLAYNSVLITRNENLRPYITYVAGELGCKGVVWREADSLWTVYTFKDSVTVQKTFKATHYNYAIYWLFFRADSVKNPNTGPPTDGSVPWTPPDTTSVLTPIRGDGPKPPVVIAKPPEKPKEVPKTALRIAKPAKADTARRP